MTERSERERAAHQPPLAQSIVAEHIEQAYILDSERQQRRIEEYGRLNKKLFRYPNLTPPPRNR